MSNEILATGVLESSSEVQKYAVDLTRYVPKFIKTDPITKQILDAEGEKVTILNYYMNDLINQTYIQTATWGLDIWEKEYGIKANSTDTIEFRRSRLLARKRGTNATTEAVIRAIGNSFVDNTIVKEHNEEYYFDLFLENYNGGFYNFLEDFMDIMSDLKPAHLDVHYHLRAILKSNLYIASVGFQGEEINVFPWTVGELETILKFDVPVAQQVSVENIVIYPQSNPSNITTNTYDTLGGQSHDTLSQYTHTELTTHTF